MENTSDNTAQQNSIPLDQIAAGISSIKHKHDHAAPCEHLEFKYCKICDIFECRKCFKEWKVEKSLNQGFFGSPNIMPCSNPLRPPYTITCINHA